MTNYLTDEEFVAFVEMNVDPEEIIPFMIKHGDGIEYAEVLEMIEELLVDMKEDFLEAFFDEEE